MIMIDYLYKMDNNKCIFNDNIECDNGLCHRCQYYYDVIGEKPKQLEIEEVLQKYGESKKEKKRRK